jgi:large subunit ribosomal protein L18e
MKTKTLIEKQTQRKRNPNLVETIRLAKKKDAWLQVASILTRPRREKININLAEIDKESKEGEKILVPGKVLSLGDVSKKIHVVALGISEVAKEKLLNQKGDFVTIAEEIKKNPEAKEIKILR